MQCRITRYYLIDQSSYPDVPTIPMIDTKGNVLATVDANMFAAAALEGSVKLKDGRVLNVSGGWVPAPPACVNVLKHIADTTYSGHYNYVGLSGGLTQIVSWVVSPTHWGIGAHHSAPLYPFFTCAVDPHVFPLGSTLYVPGLVGVQLPTGQTHNGYLWAIDVGGAIKGAHIDFFTGTKTWSKMVHIPDYLDAQLYNTNQGNS